MPLIATPLAGSGLAVRHERHAVWADMPEAFVNQILRVLAHPVIQTNLAAQGRYLVCQDYSWQVVGRSLLLAYRDASLRAARQAAFLLRWARA